MFIIHTNNTYIKQSFGWLKIIPIKCRIIHFTGFKRYFTKQMSLQVQYLHLLGCTRGLKTIYLNVGKVLET